MFFLFLALLAASCGGSNPSTAPTSPTPPVRVEGRVVDGDRGGPVGGAIVTGLQFCVPGVGCGRIPRSPAATSDDRGAFLLNADIPPNWTELQLTVTRDGFELTRTGLIAEVADTAVLKLVPMIAIRAGESIETRVVYGAYSCGEEISPCRRIMVDSPASEAMDIEVVPREGQNVGLVVGPESTHPYVPNPQRRVTVSGGEVWIYGAGKVTLTAYRR